MVLLQEPAKSTVSLSLLRKVLSSNKMRNLDSYCIDNQTYPFRGRGISF